MKSLIAYLKKQSLYAYVAIFVCISLCVSLVYFLTGNQTASTNTLVYTLVLGSLIVWYSLFKELSKGSFGVDVIAGVALIGTFIIEQYLAGVVVLLMLSGGQLFEIYAVRRARKELSSLLTRTPVVAHYKQGDSVQDIPINSVTVGMHIIIKAGEIVSVDGTIIEGETTINESSLTGESIPVHKRKGSTVYAGTENMHGVIIVVANTEAKESRYSAIIRLVEQAEKSKSPLVRLADTYSLYFTGITFIIALIAWFISYDITRVVAVLVVATPCPLLLATPIAIVSGMSKASKKGIIIKHGEALETLARTETFVFDKTGTITLGVPEVAEVVSLKRYSKDAIISIAASLDQLSAHILAQALLTHARLKKSKLSYPEHFEESIGEGAYGSVDGKFYAFGKQSFIEKRIPSLKEAMDTFHQEAIQSGRLVVFLANSKSLIGVIFFEDSPRKEAGALFKKLEKLGISKLVMLTGDKKERAEAIAETLHIHEVISECPPEGKLRYIKKFQKNHTLVAMVGDGINDAPALSGADVGIALGTHGQTAASDVADIVILSSSVGKVYDGVHIAKKTIRLAKQGILLGIGASTLAMIASAGGHITPLAGVLLQEGIDVIVILNALSLGRMLRT